MTDGQAGQAYGDGAVPASALVPARARPPQLPPVVEGSIDVALGAAVTVARPVVHVAAALARALAPLAQDTAVLVARPPLVPEALTLGGLADRLSDRGRRVREAAGQDAAVASGQGLDVVVPLVLDPVLDRIDLTGLVIERVDLARLVTAVLDRMDLTEVVLQRVDLDTIVTRALDGMDLTDVVLERVELGKVIDGALDQIDLNELVRTRVDLAGIAEEVIDDVDLPEIIRDSTTGVAGAVVDGTRLRAVEGDELVNRLVDRILLRRKARKTAAPEGSLDEGPSFLGAQQGDYAERIEKSAQAQRRESEREQQHQHEPQPQSNDGSGAESEATAEEGEPRE